MLKGELVDQLSEANNVGNRIGALSDHDRRVGVPARRRAEERTVVDGLVVGRRVKFAFFAERVR